MMYASLCPSTSILPFPPHTSSNTAPRSYVRASSSSELLRETDISNSSLRLASKDVNRRRDREGSQQPNNTRRLLAARGKVHRRREGWLTLMPPRSRLPTLLPLLFEPGDLSVLYECVGRLLKGSPFPLPVEVNLVIMSLK